MHLRAESILLFCCSPENNVKRPLRYLLYHCESAMSSMLYIIFQKIFAHAAQCFFPGSITSAKLAVNPLSRLRRQLPRQSQGRRGIVGAPEGTVGEAFRLPLFIAGREPCARPLRDDLIGVVGWREDLERSHRLFPTGNFEDCICVRLEKPSQSPAATALPEGEPRVKGEPMVKRAAGGKRAGGAVSVVCSLNRKKPVFFQDGLCFG